MKVMIDTCIIIDALQSREPFCHDAEGIFLAAATYRCTGLLTAKSIVDIYYLTHRFIHNDKDCRDILDKLFSLFELADTAGIDCQKALLSEMQDYEDAIMVETAVRIGAECIVTRNLKDYAKAPLPVYSPADFLHRINADSEDEQIS